MTSLKPGKVVLVNMDNNEQVWIIIEKTLPNNFLQGTYFPGFGNTDTIIVFKYNQIINVISS